MYNNKKPGQWRAFWYMTWYALRAQTRNPATFAFGFIFPVVFIIVFGLIGNMPQTYTIGIPNTSVQNNPITQTLAKQSYVTIEKGDETVLQNKLRQGRLASIISVSQTQSSPPTYSVTVTSTTANPQSGGAVTTIVSSLVDKMNLRLAGVKNPPVTLKQQEVSGRQFRYIDFVLPGMIGFSLLSTAIFGIVFGFVFLKKALVFKRMFATPSTPLTILLSQGTSRLIVVLIQTVLILAIGVIGFKFFLPQGLWTFMEILILSAFGLLAFMGFGLLIAGFAHDENGASPLANLVTLPQFLLSGVFFPTDNFPKWVQPIANNLPLSYFNLAVRKVTTEGGNLADTVPYLLGLAAWGLVMYLLAAKTFKWE